MPAIPLAEAAKALGTSVGTLRRWIAAGAPVSRRGRCGRGHATLVDPDTIRAWCALQRAPAGDSQVVRAAARVLAAEVPELVADAIYEAYRQVDGPHKRSMGKAMPAVWFAITTCLLDHMRQQADGTIPDPTELPDKMAQLRAVSAD
jgi:hypothetical protein